MDEEKNITIRAAKGDVSREAAILITDMVQYSTRTSEMNPGEVRDFLMEYQGKLRNLMLSGGCRPRDFEPFAGDASVAVFGEGAGGARSEKCTRALKAGLELIDAIQRGEIPSTRIGVFFGDMIEAQFQGQVMRFGNSFAVANRLEELCAFFGTGILMDREVAQAQDSEKKYTVSIGKITPKNFRHPIHVYTIYKPGIHNCPKGMSEDALLGFIDIKNEAMDLFTGDIRRGIRHNFSAARAKLREAAVIFRKITGKDDLPTLRILDYIRENPQPPDDFVYRGMVIAGKQGGSTGVRLHHLSREFFKAADREFYDVLVDNTEWEQFFKLKWVKKGQPVSGHGENSCGVSYISMGKMLVLSGDGHSGAVLENGNVFQESSIYKGTSSGGNSAIAMTDMVLNRIETDHYNRFPALQKIFERIARKRACQEAD